MARKVVVEHGLGEGKFANACVDKRNKRQRVNLQQRHVSRNFQCPRVGGNRHLVEAVEVEAQGLPGHQPFPLAVPVGSFDELRILLGQPALKHKGPLSSFGHVKGKLVGLEKDPRQAASHPLVELFVGEFALHEGFDRPVLVDLPQQMADFHAGNLLLDDRAFDLMINLPLINPGKIPL